MMVRRILIAVAALGFVAGGAYILSAAARADLVEYTDLGAAVTPTEPAYLAEIAPPSRATVKEFRIPITHETMEIAPGVTYEGWTFGGTVPDPVIRVRQGDLVRIKLVNESPMAHSIDLHAARIPTNVAFWNVMPSVELEFELVARDPGTYMVHCGTATVLMHIMQGLYLPIIVDLK